VVTTQAVKQQNREWREAAEWCRAARPKPFIERFLKIRDEQSALVPLLFDTNQEYYYRETFARLEDYYDPMRVLVVKDRKARSTTYWNACAFAFMCCVPGFVCINIVDSEKNLKTVLTMIDTFYDNLPLYTDGKDSYPMVQKGHWDTEFRELTFSAPSGGKLSSIMTFSSGRSRNFGRGGTPKMAIKSEKAHYEPTFEREQDAAISDSLPSGAWEVDESTPNGTGNAFYARFRAYEAGDLPGRVLFRRWFDRPENVFPPDSPEIRAQDALEDRESGDLRLSEEEQHLKALFGPELDPVHRILWRRRKIASAIVDAFGSEEAGKGLFYQEHPENLLDCWYHVAHPALPRDRLRQLERGCRPPMLETMPYPGIKLQIWEKGRLGVGYVGFLDPAKGVVGGDLLALQVLSASGEHVAQMFGQVNVGRFTQECCELLSREYNTALFCGEVNGNGEAALLAAKDWGYPRLYSQPKRDPHNPKEQTRWWWNTTGYRKGGVMEGTKAIMHNAMWNGLESGMVRTRSMLLVQDLLEYNPELDHTPDRVAAFMGACAVLNEKGHSIQAVSRQRSGSTGPRVVVPVPY